MRISDCSSDGCSSDLARDVDASLVPLKRYNALGIDRFIATPHVKQNMFPNTPATIRTAWEQLADACLREGLNVHIQYSAEYYLDEGFLEMLRTDQLLRSEGSRVGKKCDSQCRFGGGRY